MIELPASMFATSEDYRAALAERAHAQDAEIRKIAESMKKRPWGLGSYPIDAIAFARAVMAAAKEGK